MQCRALGIPRGEGNPGPFKAHSILASQGEEMLINRNVQLQGKLLRKFHKILKESDLDSQEGRGGVNCEVGWEWFGKGLGWGGEQCQRGKTS